MGRTLIDHIGLYIVKVVHSMRVPTIIKQILLIHLRAVVAHTLYSKNRLSIKQQWVISKDTLATGKTKNRTNLSANTINRHCHSNGKLLIYICITAYASQADKHRNLGRLCLKPFLPGYTLLLIGATKVKMRYLKMDMPYQW